MLCDEPTAALDHDNAEEVMQMLKKIAKQKLVMIVTHDIALSEKYADRIIKIEKGKIIADEILNDTAINDVKNVQNVKSVIRTFKLVMREFFFQAVKLFDVKHILAYRWLVPLFGD